MRPPLFAAEYLVGTNLDGAIIRASMRPPLFAAEYPAGRGDL